MEIFNIRAYGDDALGVEEGGIIVGGTGAVVAHTETKDEVGVDIACLLKTASATVERVLDGDAAQLAHDWDAEAFGQGGDFGIRSTFPDTVAGVQEGAFSIA